MADQNTTELTAQTNPASSDLIYTVGDPGGTPVDRKMTLSLAQTFSLTAGETLSGGEALYVKASDGKVYKCDTDADESTYSFVGIAASAASADASVAIYPPGSVATGVTSGTIGYRAYLTSSPGVISGTPSNLRLAEIGLYLTTTSILVRHPRFVRGGKKDVTNTTAQTVTTGFRPAKVHITVSPWVASAGGASVGGYPNSDGTYSTAMAMRGVDNYAQLSAHDWTVIDTNSGGAGTLISQGTMDNFTQTGFDLHASIATTGVTVVWIAEN